MISSLKLLLKSQRKRSRLTQTTSGFTLIELLIGMVMATLVITPLMTFMLNIMNSDRNEQAKANSNQEIQSALDFIAEDLKQAVYIYDSSGLNNNSTTDPTTSGIKDQIPPGTAGDPTAGAPGCRMATPTCVPVLVFWKREPKANVLKLSSSSTCPPTSSVDNCDDVYVYSLVAYYLVKGEISSGNWSDAARISRFQISDGFVNPNLAANSETASVGFQLFDLTITATTLTQKMNRWTKKNGETYTAKADVLVDFIDQSTITPLTCPTGTQRVPSTTTFPTTLPGFFYACVNSSNTSAQVFIRGNALARIENNTTYTAAKSIYFPTASVQVKGIGLLGIE